MILLAGLGNPDIKYGKTRHNVGCLVLDELGKEPPAGVILARTGTYMNNSGPAVKKLLLKYKLKPDDLWVAHDDIDLALGEFKIQKNRGSAGHKGVQSIIDALGTKDFNRIRIGICPPKGKPKAVEKFVLQNFTKTEEKTIKEVVERAVQTIQKSIS